MRKERKTWWWIITIYFAVGPKTYIRVGLFSHTQPTRYCLSYATSFFIFVLFLLSCVVFNMFEIEQHRADLELCLTLIELSWISFLLDYYWVWVLLMYVCALCVIYMRNVPTLSSSPKNSLLYYDAEDTIKRCAYREGNSQLFCCSLSGRNDVVRMVH